MRPVQLRVGTTPAAQKNWNELRNFFDGIPVPLLELSKPGSDEITYCNGAFSVLLEDHAQAVIGEQLHSFASSDKDKQRLLADSGAGAGQRDLERPYTVQLTTRNGAHVPVRFDWLEKIDESEEDNGCLLFASGVGEGSTASGRSILRVFYEIVEHSGEAIGIATETGSHLYRNAAHRELFGKEDTPNAEFNVLDILTPESQQKIFDDVRESVDESGQWVGVLESYTPDGMKPIWVRTHEIVDPVSDRPIRFALMHDHSEELALRNELAQAKAAAERAHKAQQDLFFALSHDFRATLQGASLYLDVADRTAIKNALEIKEIGRAREAVLSLQDHFNQLLDLFAKDSPELEPHIEYISGQSLLDYVARTYGPMAEAKKVDLVFDNCSDVFPSDPTLIRRIVGNLVSNAIKFTDEGEVRVDCTIEQGRKVLRVADTGIGIPAEYHQKIFEQFYRLDPNGPDGLGVGLSITKHLCDLLGHELSLASAPGKGSTFTVTVKSITTGG